MDSEVYYILEDTTNLLRISYIKNLFNKAKDFPKQGHYFCKHSEDQTKDLIVTIIGRLNILDNLSLRTKLYLQVVFNSLIGC